MRCLDLPLELLIAPKVLTVANLLEIAVRCWMRWSLDDGHSDKRGGHLAPKGCSEGWPAGMMDYTGFTLKALLTAFLLEMAISCTSCWAEMLALILLEQARAFTWI